MDPASSPASLSVAARLTGHDRASGHDRACGHDVAVDMTGLWRWRGCGDDVAVELTLFAGEPATGPWVVESVDHVVARLLSSVPDKVAIPVVAVDGRSGSGKSTAAQRIAATIPGAAVLRTDDVAWHHSYFDWTGLLRDGVLDPVRRGRLPVSYRPPAWSARSRPSPSKCQRVAGW